MLKTFVIKIIHSAFSRPGWDLRYVALLGLSGLPVVKNLVSSVCLLARAVSRAAGDFEGDKKHKPKICLFRVGSLFRKELRVQD